MDPKGRRHDDDGEAGDCVPARAPRVPREVRPDQREAGDDRQVAGEEGQEGQRQGEGLLQGQVGVKSKKRSQID